jgi:hypothetical protein
VNAHYEYGPTTRLVGRYCDAVARFDLEVFASIWAEDAIWYIASGDDRHGRKAIVELFREARALFELCIQETLSSVIDPIGHARWYVRELQWRKDGTTSQLIGVYDDTLSGPPEDPLFASRRFTPLYRGPIDLSGQVFDSSKLGPGKGSDRPPSSAT